jgi:6-phosphogluconate dehydrogenase (decarboxylating)
VNGPTGLVLPLPHERTRMSTIHIHQTTTATPEPFVAGGDEDAYRRVEPVLRVLGTPHYVGENGQGLVLKLAINISLAVQMLAFSEGLLLAERDGIDPHRAAAVLPFAGVADEVLTDAIENGYEHRDIVALHELLARDRTGAMSEKSDHAG